MIPPLHKHIIILFVLAFVFRFPGLDKLPPSLNLDEVAIGYNAYSILKTGMDEYGTTFPIAFRSHDDYKAPLYIYLSVLPVFLWGLTPFAVRFVSALSGTLAVPVLFLLLHQFKLPPKFAAVPFLGAAILAITPWHIQISRMALETNFAFTLFLAAILFFYLGRSRPVHWLFSAMFFVLSLYAYHSLKLFLPPFLVFLAWQNRRLLIRRFKLVLALSATSFVLLLPLLIFSLTPAGQLRFQGTSLLASSPEFILNNHNQLLDIWRSGYEYEAKAFHNFGLSAALLILKNYFLHFSYPYLFHGEYAPPVNHTPNVGLLYLWQLPLIIVGLYNLFRYRLECKNTLVMCLLLAPIAAALTWDTPSSNRTVLMLFPLSVATALGLVHLGRQIHRRYLFRLLLFTLVGFFLADYLHNYIRLTPKIYAQHWQYGYDQAVGLTQNLKPQYSQVVVSTNLRQPQNFWAFYLGYDPATYIHHDGGTISGGFNETRNAFDKFHFRPITSADLISAPPMLFVDLYVHLPPNIVPLHTVLLPNGKPYLVIFSNLP